MPFGTRHFFCYAHYPEALVWLRRRRNGGNLLKNEQFITHPDVDTFIAEARRRNPHQPHSVASLILGGKGVHALLTLPQDASDRGAEHARVPPQMKLPSGVRAVDVAKSIIQGILDRLRVSEDDVVYLGSTKGKKHLGGDKRYGKKHIHWFGFAKTGRSFYHICQPSADFPLVEWLRMQQVLDLTGGEIVSPEKGRMIMQAYVVLARAYHDQPAPLADIHRRLKEVNQLPRILQVA